jgi:hypothetical protein
LQAFPLDRDEYALYRRIAIETVPATSEAVHGRGTAPGPPRPSVHRRSLAQAVSRRRHSRQRTTTASTSTPRKTP